MQNIRYEFVEKPVTAWGGMRMMKELIDRTGIKEFMEKLPSPNPEGYKEQRHIYLGHVPFETGLPCYAEHSEKMDNSSVEIKPNAFAAYNNFWEQIKTDDMKALLIENIENFFFFIFRVGKVPNIFNKLIIIKPKNLILNRKPKMTQFSLHYRYLVKC